LIEIVLQRKIFNCVMANRRCHKSFDYSVNSLRQRIKIKFHVSLQTTKKSQRTGTILSVAGTRWPGLPPQADLHPQMVGRRRVVYIGDHGGGFIFGEPDEAQLKPSRA
jgi:hypothetical protein